MVIWNMNLQMHDKLYAGFVGRTKQDQKLGMNPTFTYFDIYVLLKAQNQKLWKLQYRWIQEQGWEIS